MRTSSQTARLESLILYACVILVAFLAFLIFQPFLVPLGWAAVLAVLFHPWTGKLKVRWGAARSAVFGTICVTLVLIVPGILLAAIFTFEGAEAVRDVQGKIASGRFNWVIHRWYSLAQWAGDNSSDLQHLLNAGIQRVETYLAGQMAAFLGNLVLLIFDLFVTLFALYYFFYDGDVIMRRIRDLLPFERETRDRILVEAEELIHASVRVNLFIAALEGFLGGAGFALVGIPSPVFWGILMSFLALLPVLGTWPVWLPATIWLFATGSPLRGSVLAGVAVLILLVDHVLRATMLSGHVQLSGLSVFIAVLGGLAAFGMLGIILGPIVLATGMAVLEGYLRRARPA